MITGKLLAARVAPFMYLASGDDMIPSGKNEVRHRVEAFLCSSDARGLNFRVMTAWNEKALMYKHTYSYSKRRAALRFGEVLRTFHRESQCVADSMKSSRYRG